jgi:carbon-monoxide dehydrogenase medium subunit
VLAQAVAGLIDVNVTPATLSDAASMLGDELDPQEDQQASVAMRRYLAKLLLVRGVAALLARPELAGEPA